MIALLLMLFTSLASAAPWASVDLIWEQDASGRWQTVRSTGAATLVRQGETATLSRGDELLPGDVVQTGLARVRIRYDDGAQTLMTAESELTLAERSVLQSLGEALYEVRGAFRVEYRSVEAAVEGTRFLVGPAAEGGARVAVQQGKVRVGRDGQSVLVPRARASTVLEDQAPGAPAKLSDADRRLLRQLDSAMGEPRFSVAAMFGGAWAVGEGVGQLRLMGRARLTPGWRAVVDAGVSSQSTRFYLPLSVGIDRRLGRFGVGLSVVGLLGQECIPCTGEERNAVYVGATAMGRYRLPLTHSLALETVARFGYVQGFYSDLALGVSAGR